MTGWRFALSKRWAGYLGLTITFAVVCSLLGQWQFDRRAQAQAEIARIDANYDSAPVAVATALPRLSSFTVNQRWLPVTLTGRYLPELQQLVRNRPYNGRPGFEVLTPLLLESGTVFIVDRGWLSVGSRQDAPDVVPKAPSGEVTVVARLKAGEPLLSGRRTVAGSGQIPTINLAQLADLVNRPSYTGAYGLLASESVSSPVLPAPSLRPIRDEGPHLSYALQWYVFALLGFIGLGWALRQEYRAVNAEDPEERERAEERARRRAERSRREPSDSETEDAILDRSEPELSR